MKEFEEYSSRLYGNSPIMIQQSIAMNTVENDRKTVVGILLNKFKEWLFPENRESPLPPETYHTRNLPL